MKLHQEKEYCNGSVTQEKGLSEKSAMIWV